MSADLVVDIAQAPTGLRRFRAMLRIGVPLAGVIVVIAAVVSIVLYSERANRTGVLLLSDDLLTNLQERIGQEVIAYLTPASRAARLARSMMAGNATSERDAEFEAFASSALREIPQIDAIYNGDAEGNFLMIQRGTDGGADTEVIHNAPGARTVDWVQRDSSGRITEHRLDPEEAYDPRKRDWYKGALQSDDVFWTGVYVFFTKRQPGVTVAVGHDLASGDSRVFGVDITLETLSAFLDSLRIGRHGRAAIIDDTGHLVAGPNISRLVHDPSGQLVTARLDEAGDPLLAAAYDHFRVEGYGRRIITVGNTRVVAISSRLPAVGRTWSLLMVVPEEDFTGFVANNARTALWLSLIVVAFIVVLIAFVVRYGLRADRAARRLLERGRGIERQSIALEELARQPSMFDRSQAAPLRSLTTALASLADARRVGVWQMLNEGRLLDCEDAYERDSGDHLAGLRLTRYELPLFFAALDANEDIQVGDAAADRRTAEFQRVLMHPFGSHSLFVVPVRTDERLLGAITLEDATRLSDTHHFVTLAANMLAIRMSHDAPATTAAHPDELAVVSASVGEQSFECDLVTDADIASANDDQFRSVAVMELKISDDVPMAKRITDAATLGDRIATIVQDVAIAHKLPYAKLVGYQAIAAAGFTADDTGALLRVADASVAVRERCLELFQASGLAPSFHLGLDCGSAVGSHVGHEPRLFNLWGSVVRTAELLASTGTSPGMIQVSEAAYRVLREHFVFRLRGTFYRPGVGLAQAFVLASRQ
jgi:adenylate cyclase